MREAPRWPLAARLGTTAAATATLACLYVNASAQAGASLRVYERAGLPAAAGWDPGLGFVLASLLGAALCGLSLWLAWRAPWTATVRALALLLGLLAWSAIELTPPFDAAWRDAVGSNAALAFLPTIVLWTAAFAAPLALLHVARTLVPWREPPTLDRWRRADSIGFFLAGIVALQLLAVGASGPADVAATIARFAGLAALAVGLAWLVRGAWRAPRGWALRRAPLWFALGTTLLATAGAIWAGDLQAVARQPGGTEAAPMLVVYVAVLAAGGYLLALLLALRAREALREAPWLLAVFGACGLVRAVASSMMSAGATDATAQQIEYLVRTAMYNTWLPAPVVAAIWVLTLGCAGADRAERGRIRWLWLAALGYCVLRLLHSLLDLAAALDCTRLFGPPHAAFCGNPVYGFLLAYDLPLLVLALGVAIAVFLRREIDTEVDVGRIATYLVVSTIVVPVFFVIESAGSDVFTRLLPQGTALLPAACTLACVGPIKRLAEWSLEVLLRTATRIVAQS